MVGEAAAGAPAFQIRFPPISTDYKAVAFPCDVSGHVDLDRLNDAERYEYFFARVMARRARRPPQIVAAAEAA
jgi:hypothetical protein